MKSQVLAAQAVLVGNVLLCSLGVIHSKAKSMPSWLRV